MSDSTSRTIRNRRASCQTSPARLDPAAVIDLSLIVVGIAMVMEQRLPRRRDADDVGHGALAEVRHRRLVDQALP